MLSSHVLRKLKIFRDKYLSARILIVVLDTHNVLSRSLVPQFPRQISLNLFNLFSSAFLAHEGKEKEGDKEFHAFQQIPHH